MPEYTDTPMSLVPKFFKPIDDSQITEELVEDRELEKLALLAGGPNTKGIYKEKKK